MKNLTVFNGLTFNEGTNEKVMNIISNCLTYKTKIRVWYGDIKTGKSWDEEYDTIGTVGRSTGTNKIPLLIKNARSYGGGALLCDSIVKIVNVETKNVMYQHENFKQAIFKAVGTTVLSNSEVWGSGFKTEIQAQNCAKFMNGERMCK